MSATFRVTIETDNDAFADEPEQEIARILRRIALDIKDGRRRVDGRQRVLDINGNAVGETTCVEIGDTREYRIGHADGLRELVEAAGQAAEYVQRLYPGNRYTRDLRAALAKLEGETNGVELQVINLGRKTGRISQEGDSFKYCYPSGTWSPPGAVKSLEEAAEHLITARVERAITRFKRL